MKFSLQWLGDFIPVEAFLKDPDQLVDRLTQAGLEVESIENSNLLFKNIVVAQIESVKKHSQADRLTVCEVFDGQKNHQIVCGAKNHKAGDKVFLALPGACLPGDFKIKKTRLRGITSEGMLVSKKELGLAIQDDKDQVQKQSTQDQQEGIWILPPEAKIGISLSQQLKLDDVILDMAIPPNRPDALSHKGLAREIACLFSLPFHQKKFSLLAKGTLLKKSFTVKVKEPKACPRYCGRLITGVTIKDSPSWLKNRLKSLNLKSINNVVDITNFVLWDRGQPLHAFDKDKIKTLIVDYAKPKEKFIALDQTELTLSSEDLTIRDENHILALAGVIGGLNSSITDATKNIFIEAAAFAPEKIRKTVRRYGLQTDSSYRFTRGVDPTAVKEAMDYACFLIQKEAGGEISQDFYDFFTQDHKSSCSIKITLHDLESRLGYKVKSKDFEDKMKSLNCKTKAIEAGFELIPPAYRSDLNIKEDFIEEFARLNGYDKIPETLVSLTGVPKPPNLNFLNSQKAIRFLSTKGWYQALNYSFCDPKFYKEFLKGEFYLQDLLAKKSVTSDSRQSTSQENSNTKHLAKTSANPDELLGEASHIAKTSANPDELISDLKQIFYVGNPISQKLSLMKPLLTPDLVSNMLYNFRRNNKFGQLFELSPIFYKKANSYQQTEHLALIRWGRSLDIWQKNPPLNVYYIKSVIESLFKALGLKNWSWETANLSFLHPGQTLKLVIKNKSVGFLGTLNPYWLQKYKSPLDIALLEMDWDFLSGLNKKALKFKKLSALNPVEKDLCFSIPKNLLVEHVRQEIQNSLKDLSQSVEVFDIYQTDKDRFVSFRLYLKAKDHSLTDKEIQDCLNGVIKQMSFKFSIHLK